MAFTKNKWLLCAFSTGLLYIMYLFICNHLVRHQSSAKQTGYLLLSSPDLHLGKLDNQDNITYTRIHQFLLSTPPTVMRATPPKYLRDVKNPCFALDKNFVNVGNINLSYALKMNYEIRCLPYVYIAGVEKCGTGDLHHSLMPHPLIRGFLNDDQLEEYERLKASGDYAPHNILGNMSLVQNLYEMRLKESHFWDNIRCFQNFTMDHLSRRCTPELIVRSHLKYGDSGTSGEENDFRNMVYIDSTPRMAGGQFHWNEEEVHWYKKEPTEFIPDRLYHVVPEAKVIFTLREPVSRTFSDYRFLTKLTQSSEEFHHKVVEAIDWWHNCTALYRATIPKACAYGNAPMGLPPHNTRSCGRKAEAYNFFCSPVKEWGCANSIDRLRLSIYHIYLSEWLRVFPRHNILILKLEDTYSDKIGTLNRILEFLELPPLSPELVDTISQAKAKNKSKQLIQMWNETRTILEEFFRPMNMKLSELLQEDFY